jgi:UDPglucose 6-dehydrogenase
VEGSLVRVGIFGAGHVGLVTAVCLAELGHAVVAVDKVPEIVTKLAEGVPTFYEPGLAELLEANLRAGRLTFTLSPEEAMRTSDIVFLCVGTPEQPDGKADLSQIDEVVRTIAPLLDHYTIVVEKSTVPVNTAICIERTIRQSAPRGSAFDVVSNPEFLREGSAIQDFLHPDRIIIGADSERARALLQRLYGDGFHCPILMTSVKMAELIKHAANAFLATKISFINMVADVCEKVGGDVTTVAKGIGLDHRIGPHFLRAGLGFGGSCFHKDLNAFARIAEELGVDFSLLREVDRINEARIGQLLGKIDQALWVARGKTVGVLGVAFKAGTDDIRDAPSLRVIAELRERGAVLQIYDPKALSKMATRFSPDERLRYVGSAHEAARGAHALLILTEWEEFRSLDLTRLRSLMRTPVIVDGRGMFDPATTREAGFEYYSLGRGDVVHAGLATGARRDA